MTDLLYAGGDNPGGLDTIRFVPVVGVASLPLPAAGTVVSPPTFQPGYAWLTAYGTPFTKSYDETDDEPDNGPLWSVTVSLFLPGDSAARRAQLALMKPQRYIIECRDNAGLWRRVGTRVESLRLATKFSAGKAVGDARGHTLTFSGTLTAPPPIVVLP